MDVSQFIAGWVTDIGEELRGISDNWSPNRGMYMQTNFRYGALLFSTLKIGVIK